MSYDPWEIGEELDALVEEWDPETELELPSMATSDESWVWKRLQALQFALREVAELEGQMDRAEAELAKRRLRAVGPLEKKVERLEWQLGSYHRAFHATARRLKKKVGASIQTPHGVLRSKGPTVKATVQVLDEGLAVQWLKENGFSGMVKEVPAKAASEKVDIVKARAAVVFGDDGDPAVVNADGEVCPFLGVTAGDSKYWVEFDEGEDQ